MARTFTDPDDIILSANEPQAYATSGNSVQTDGTVGDIVFRTSGVERARIKADGTGTGWGNVLGGSLSASGDPALPVGGSTVVQLADRSEPTFPTVEELFVHRGFDGTISGAGAAVFKKVFTAPFPLWVRDIWAANDGSDLSGLSGSVFWSLRPRRYRIVTAAGGIASSTEFVDILDSTGTNFSLISNKAQGETFRFDGVTYDASNSKFRTGDSLWMRIAPSGGPANLSDISFTVRWEPV